MRIFSRQDHRTIHIPIGSKTYKCAHGVSHAKLLIRPSFSLLKTAGEAPNHWQRLHIWGKPIHILKNRLRSIRSRIGRHHVDKAHILHHETPLLERDIRLMDGCPHHCVKFLNRSLRWAINVMLAPSRYLMFATPSQELSLKLCFNEFACPI